MPGAILGLREYDDGRFNAFTNNSAQREELTGLVSTKQHSLRNRTRRAVALADGESHRARHDAARQFFDLFRKRRAE